jgi:hypothetical protein
VNPDRELGDASVWYINFLEGRLQEAWGSMLTKILADLDLDVADENEPPEPTKAELVIAYRLMCFIADSLRSSKDFSLRGIADKLHEKGFLRSHSDETLAAAEQLAFSVLGWLTMLYNPKLHPDPRKLEIADSLETYRRINGMRSRVSEHCRSDLSPVTSRSTTFSDHSGR